LKQDAIFTDTGRQRIREAIAEAEKITSGEVRVFVDKRCKGSELDHAATVFEKLKMHETKERNGILFYVSVSDRKFAVIGDAGIHARVQDAFWNDVRDAVLGEFKKGDLVGGLVMGVKRAGEALRTHFPRQTDDRNELPDDIVFGK